MEKRVYFKKYRRAEFTSKILIFMLLFGSFFTLVSPVGADPIAAIWAENITLEPNSYAVVGVYADVPSPGLAGYDLDINYDPSKIQIVGITRSAFFSPPIPEFGVNDLNPSSIPGKLTVVYASSRGTQGTFKLFNVQVKALETLTDVSPFSITVKDFVGPDLADLTPNLQVTWIPNEPNVSADNQNNLIVGLAEGMEYSIDNSEFTPFIPGNLPNLSGNHTVFVRIAGTDTSPPGAERMLKFNTLEPVSIPQASVGSTTYHDGNMDYIAHDAVIHLTSTTSGVTFYYTIGGPGNEPGDPSSEGTVYDDGTGIFSIPDGKTIIKVIAVKAGMDNSSIATFTFINQVSTPYVIVNGIQYNHEEEPTALSVPQGVPVFLGSYTGSDVSFYYTTDGSIPTTGSTSYNPLTGITNLPLETTTLKVLGTKNTLLDSGTPTFLVTVSQLISDAPTLAQISVLNNLTGTDDTVTVQDLFEGDTVKVYADASSQTVLGTATLAQGSDSVTVSIPQLGTVAGTVYVSVTSLGMSESSRTVVAYSAETTMPTPTMVVKAGFEPSENSRVEVKLATQNVTDYSVSVLGTQLFYSLTREMFVGLVMSVDQNAMQNGLLVTEVSPTLIKYGDVNMDTNINVLDAIAVVRIATGRTGNPTIIAKLASDVTGDGNINVLDAIQIVRKATGRVQDLTIDTLK